MGEGYIRTKVLGQNFIKELIYDEFMEYNSLVDKKELMDFELIKLKYKYNYYNQNPSSKNKTKILNAKKELDDLEKRIDMFEYNISPEARYLYSGVVYALKHNSFIKKDHYLVLMDLFKKNNLSEYQIVKLLDYIKIHNIIANCQKKNMKIEYDKLYKIMDIINCGYEEYNIDNFNIEKKQELDIFIYNTINYYKNKEWNNFFINIEYLIRTYSDINDFKYIINNILIILRNDLYKMKNEICTLDNYQDKETRRKLVYKYENILDIYKKVRNTLDEESYFNMKKTKNIVNKKNL